MPECYHISISSKGGLGSDVFVPCISLPLFVCSLFMILYLFVYTSLCSMNGQDWISHKGLGQAEMMLVICSTRYFLHVQQLEDSLSLRFCCCVMPRLVATRGSFDGEGRLRDLSPLCPGGTAEGVVNGDVRSGINSRGATSQLGCAADLEVWITMPWIQEWQLSGFRSPTF